MKRQQALQTGEEGWSSSDDPVKDESERVHAEHAQVQIVSDEEDPGGEEWDEDVQSETIMYSPTATEDQIEFGGAPVAHKGRD